MEYIKNTGEGINIRRPTTCPRGGACLVAPLVLHRPQLQLYIFMFGEKKIKEKDSQRLMIRSCRQALISLGRADLSPFGAPERGICRHRHHQPSSITHFIVTPSIQSYTNHTRKCVRSISRTHGKISQHNSRHK